MKDEANLKSFLYSYIIVHVYSIFNLFKAEHYYTVEL